MVYRLLLGGLGFTHKLCLNLSAHLSNYLALHCPSPSFLLSIRKPCAYLLKSLFILNFIGHLMIGHKKSNDFVDTRFSFLCSFDLLSDQNLSEPGKVLAVPPLFSPVMTDFIPFRDLSIFFSHMGILFLTFWAISLSFSSWFSFSYELFFSPFGAAFLQLLISKV